MPTTSGSNVAFVVSREGLKRTENFQSYCPAWKLISPEGVDCDQFAFHPLVKGVGFLDGEDGVWKCEDLYADIPEWRKQ